MWWRVCGLGVIAATLMLASWGRTALAAEATQTGQFSDDDGSVHEPYLEAVVAAGVMTPCAEGQVCPTDPVSRGEMAAFIHRAFPNATTSSRSVATFTDIAGSSFEDDIEWMGEVGISRGCGGSRYCPDALVTRGEVAAFVRRALGLSPVPAPFGDSARSIFADDVAAIAGAGFVRGCNPPSNTSVCPNRLATRGEIATILARALGSSRTTEVGGQPDDDSPLLGPVEDLAASQATPNGDFDSPNLGDVDLSWRPPADTGSLSVASYEFRVRTGTGEYDAWQPTQNGAAPGFTHRCDLEPFDSLPETCTYEVRAVSNEGAGAVAVEVMAEGLFDATPPTPAVLGVEGATGAGPDLVAESNVTLRGTAGSAVGDAPTVSVRIVAVDDDSTVWEETGITVVGDEWIVTPVGVADGDYRVVVSQLDWSENRGVGERGLTVDSSGPVIVIVSPAPGETLDGDSYPTISGTTDTPGAVDVSLYSADDCSGVLLGEMPAAAEGDAAPFGWAVTFRSILGDTPAGVLVRQADEAGNTTTSCYAMLFSRMASSSVVISIGDASVVEGNQGTRRAMVAVTLSEPAAAPVLVDYVVRPGTATAGNLGDPDADFHDGDGSIATLEFLPGVLDAFVAVPIYGDEELEEAETVEVELSNARGAASIGNTTGIVTILDDEPRTPTEVQNLVATTALPNGDFDSPNLGDVELTWDAPLSSGTETILHYAFQVKVGSGAFSDWQESPNGLATTMTHRCDQNTADVIPETCTYRIAAVSSLGAGPAAETSAIGLVDTTPPQVGIQRDAFRNPAAPDTTSQRYVRLYGRAGIEPGDEPVVNVQIISTTGSVVWEGEAPTGGFDLWSTIAYPLDEGSYRIVVSQRDWSGKQASDERPLTVDWTPPVIEIESPVSGQILDGGVAATISGTVDSTEPFEVAIDVLDASICGTGFSSSQSPQHSVVVAQNGSWSTSFPQSLSASAGSVFVSTRDTTGNYASDCVPVVARDGIWVDGASGDDSNSGSQAAPLASIQAAIDLAAPDQLSVYVSSGDEYTGAGPLHLASGVGIYGGFTVDDGVWKRPGTAGVPGRVDASSTVYTSATQIGAVADGDVGVVLDGLTIKASDASGPGASSYGLQAYSNSEVSIANAAVEAGDGADGVDGLSASQDGGPGASGRSGGSACNNCGTQGAGGTGGAGGNRGAVGGVGGLPGENDGGGSYVGGTGGGAPGEADNVSCSAGDNAGGKGGRAVYSASPGGSGGAGGTTSILGGDFNAIFWTPTSGFGGGAGSHGYGGAGGGGGAGDRADLFGCGLAGDAGAGGGGGGGGGRGGSPGLAGFGGGGSFGIYVHSSTVTLTFSTVTAGTGGTGGDGGNGSVGGDGGSAGAGGSCGASTAGSGGGGAGGYGAGGGGGGGGGAGGPAIAVYERGSGTVTVDETTLRSGTAGQGGRGGAGGAGGSGGSGGAAGACTPSVGSTGGADGLDGASGSNGANGHTGLLLRSYIDEVRQP